MAECLREAGCQFEHTAYEAAASKGNLAMIRWLATEVVGGVGDMAAVVHVAILGGVLEDYAAAWLRGLAAAAQQELAALNRSR